MAFPTVTTSLDTFTGGLGTRWTTQVSPGVKAVTVSGNGAISGNGTGDTSQSGYYNVASYGPNFEMQVDYLADGGSGSWAGYGASKDQGAGTTDGYAIYLDLFGGSALSYWRIDNGVETKIGADETTYTPAVGDSWGLERAGNSLIAHTKNAGSWTQRGSRTDSTYNSGTFNFFVDVYYDYDSSGIALDNLAGGTVGAAAASVHRLLMMGCGV